MTQGPGIEPRPHWWEASALTTGPSLHVCVRLMFLFHNDRYRIRNKDATKCVSISRKKIRISDG